MKVAFQDESFAFEFVRNLGFMYYGGADLGEMIATAGEIAEGDVESWFAGWDRRARRTLARADASLAGGHPASARESYLRTSTYFRMAEFYLHGDPGDPRILAASRASREAYAKAAELTGPTWEPVEIPYEGTTLPGYFFKADDSGEPRPTIIFHGGIDSSLEELYYFCGAPAVRRGYHCLAFDGPGQGGPAREQKLYFRHDWEKVVTPVVDYALKRPDVDGDGLVLVGMSLGGYFAARAAAFERRLRAAVFYDGVYDLHESIRKMTPEDAMAAFDSGDADEGRRIIDARMKHDSVLFWAVTQGTWSFGVPNFDEFLHECEKYTLDDVVGRIECPCLVMEAEGDLFFRGQPLRVYDGLKSAKTFVRFGPEDGAENHCQSGALAYKDEVVFNWIDETLNVRDGRQS